MSKPKGFKGVIIAKGKASDAEVKAARARGMAFLAKHADTYKGWFEQSDSTCDFRGPLAGKRKRALMAN